MGQRFFQGRTNNHLTYVMVDATDFATPESALSAATKIKIYGKLQGATGVNFVSSGTGSLTNDIQHVGASVLGIYTIALAKADLSDASAAWYDQYIVSLSATGAAYQTLVVPGVLSGGSISNISGAISDVQSYLVAMSGMLSDVQSAVLLAQSFASDAASAAQQGNSRVLLTQSFASDAASAAQQANSRVLLAQSFASDAASAAQQANSRVLLGNSMISDVDSALTSQFLLTTSTLSDIDSALTSQFNATSDAISNVMSAVLIAQSQASDVYSALTANRAEPGQGTPAASTSALAKLDWLYKAWRNRTTQTATEYNLFADDATTVDQKATVSDNGTTFDRTEIATGP